MLTSYLQQKEVFLVIDGNGLIIASYYIAEKSSISLPYALQTAKNKILLMFINSLEKIVQSINPNYLCVCFDDGSKTFRHTILPEYKKHRDSLPDLLIEQLINIPDFLEKNGIVSLTNRKLESKFALNCNGIQWNHVEADDIIATVVKKFSVKPSRYQFMIYTNDYDISQLIDDSTSLLMKNRRKKSAPLFCLDEKEFFKIFQVKASQFIDFLAIKGDNSDNIPGVLGLGMKRTAKLLRDYSSIDGIYERLEELPYPMQELFVENKEAIIRNKELVTLKICNNFDYPVEDFVFLPKSIKLLKETLTSTSI